MAYTNWKAKKAPHFPCASRVEHCRFCGRFIPRGEHIIAINEMDLTKVIKHTLGDQLPMHTECWEHLQRIATTDQELADTLFLVTHNTPPQMTDAERRRLAAFKAICKKLGYTRAMNFDFGMYCRVPRTRHGFIYCYVTDEFMYHNNGSNTLEYPDDVTADASAIRLALDKAGENV